VPWLDVRAAASPVSAKVKNTAGASVADAACLAACFEWIGAGFQQSKLKRHNLYALNWAKIFIVNHGG
jgi:hypothetical protein